MYDVLKDESLFSGKTAKTISQFVRMVEGWQKAVESGNRAMGDIFEDILEETGYRAMLEENRETDRLENLKELLDDIHEYSDNNPDSSLEEYLQVVSLYGDKEQVMESEYVQLMTVHAAKGLEFRYRVCVGYE